MTINFNKKHIVIIATLVICIIAGSILLIVRLNNLEKEVKKNNKDLNTLEISEYKVTDLAKDKLNNFIVFSNPNINDNIEYYHYNNYDFVYNLNTYNLKVSSDGNALFETTFNETNNIASTEFCKTAACSSINKYRIINAVIVDNKINIIINYRINETNYYFTNLLTYDMTGNLLSNKIIGNESFGDIKSSITHNNTFYLIYVNYNNKNVNSLYKVSLDSNSSLILSGNESIDNLMVLNGNVVYSYYKDVENAESKLNYHLNDNNIIDISSLKIDVNVNKVIHYNTKFYVMKYSDIKMYSNEGREIAKFTYKPKDIENSELNEILKKQYYANEKCIFYICSINNHLVIHYITMSGMKEIEFDDTDMNNIKNININEYGNIIITYSDKIDYYNIKEALK